MNSLNKLFDTIENNLKNNIKLSSQIDILKQYNGNDWLDYVKINKEKYNRNIVKKNDLFELAIITWDINQKTKIHGHPKGGCLFKVIHGNINENFHKKRDKIIHRINTYKMNDISYIDNSIGYHSMHNNYDDMCVSLHIYSPPFNNN